MMGFSRVPDAAQQLVSLPLRRLKLAICVDASVRPSRMARRVSCFLILTHFGPNRFALIRPLLVCVCSLDVFGLLGAGAAARAGAGAGAGAAAAPREERKDEFDQSPSGLALRALGQLESLERLCLFTALQSGAEQQLLRLLRPVFALPSLQQLDLPDVALSAEGSAELLYATLPRASRLRTIGVKQFALPPAAAAKDSAGSSAGSASGAGDSAAGVVSLQQQPRRPEIVRYTSTTSGNASIATMLV